MKFLPQKQRDMIMGPRQKSKPNPQSATPKAGNEPNYPAQGATAPMSKKQRKLANKAAREKAEQEAQAELERKHKEENGEIPTTPENAEGGAAAEKPDGEKADGGEVVDGEKPEGDKSSEPDGEEGENGEKPNEDGEGGKAETDPDAVKAEPEVQNPDVPSGDGTEGGVPSADGQTDVPSGDGVPTGDGTEGGVPGEGQPVDGEIPPEEFVETQESTEPPPELLDKSLHEDDPEMMDIEERKKYMAQYQSELLEILKQNDNPVSLPHDSLISELPPQTTSKCSIYDCLRNFTELEELSIEEGNGVECYPCTRQAFFKSGISIDYLTRHFPEPEKELQEQIKTLQSEGHPINEAFYSQCEIDGKYTNFVNPTIRPKLMKRTAKKQLMIEQSPPVLTIHFKRFLQTAYDIQKVSVPLDFPLHLDLSPYAKKKSGDNTSWHYELFGVCNHSGSFGGGHYTAFTKINSFTPSGPKGEWFYFSDTQFHKVDVKQVLGSEGYILFYERVPDPNQTQPKPQPPPTIKHNDGFPTMNDDDDFPEYNPDDFK